MELNKYQQGGAAPAGELTQEEQQKLTQIVQAAAQGDQKARQTVEQIMKAAQETQDPKAVQYAEFITQLLSSAQRKKIGGQLAYIHMLRTGERPGEEINYHRCGGKVSKTKKPKACGGTKVKVEEGGKVPAKKTYFEACGGKAKTSGKKKCYFGGSL